MCTDYYVECESCLNLYHPCCTNIDNNISNYEWICDLCDYSQPNTQEIATQALPKASETNNHLEDVTSPSIHTVSETINTRTLRGAALQKLLLESNSDEEDVGPKFDYMAGIGNREVLAEMRRINKLYFCKDSIASYVEEQMEKTNRQTFYDIAHSKWLKQKSDKRFKFTTALNISTMKEYKISLIDLETKRRELSYFEKYGLENVGPESFYKYRKDRLEFLDKHGHYLPDMS